MQVDSKADDTNLTKVVLARRTDINVDSDIDTLGLLQTLQVRFCKQSDLNMYLCKKQF